MSISRRAAEYIALYTTVRSEIAGLSIAWKEWAKTSSAMHEEFKRRLDALAHTIETLFQLKRRMETELGLRGTEADHHIRTLCDDIEREANAIRSGLWVPANERRSMEEKEKRMIDPVTKLIDDEKSLLNCLKDAGLPEQLSLPEVVVMPTLPAISITRLERDIVLVTSHKGAPEIVKFLPHGEIIPWVPLDPRPELLPIYGTPILQMEVEATDLCALHTLIGRKLLKICLNDNVKNYPNVIIAVPIIYEQQQVNGQYRVFALYNDRIASTITVENDARSRRSSGIDYANLDCLATNVVAGAVVSAYGYHISTGDVKPVPLDEKSIEIARDRIVDLGVQARRLGTALVRQEQGHTRSLLKEVGQKLELLESQASRAMEASAERAHESLGILQGSVQENTTNQIMEELKSMFEKGLSLEDKSDLEPSISDSDKFKPEDDGMDVDD